MWGVAVRLSYIQDARCLKVNMKFDLVCPMILVLPYHYHSTGHPSACLQLHIYTQHKDKRAMPGRSCNKSDAFPAVGVSPAQLLLPASYCAQRQTLQQAATDSGRPNAKWSTFGLISCRTQLICGRYMFTTQISTTCFGACGHLHIDELAKNTQAVTFGMRLLYGGGGAGLLDGGTRSRVCWVGRGVYMGFYIYIL